MNGSEIHWIRDGLILLGLLAAFIVICPCILSNKISRDEEARETRAAFDRMKRAA